jgi:type VII secretion integral membrane protein EccD
MSFSRVTLVGERQRVDAVLPSEEPVGRLLPDVLRLLGDAPMSPPHHRHLVTSDGGILPWDGTLAAAGVADGAVLTLVRADDAPPAPVVHDVTEEAADDIDLRAWRWGPRARRWTATALAGVLFFVVADLAGAPIGRSAGLVLGICAAAFVLAGGLVGRFVHEPTGSAVTVGGGALAVRADWFAANAYDWAAWGRWGSVFLTVAVLLAVLGVTSPLGLGGVIGGGFAGVLTGAWMAGGAADMAAARLAALLSVASIVLLGLLPRLALSMSGLAALDDRRIAGGPVRRQDVRTALAATHRGLAVATVAAAMSATVAGRLLAGDPGRWTVPLAALLAVVLASRSRTFPLVVQVVVLQGAALVVLVGLLASWRDQGSGSLFPALAAVVAAAAPVAVLAVRPPEHIRVRLRRFTDRLEALAVIAMIPVAIGVFGTYGRLLHVVT